MTFHMCLSVLVGLALSPIAASLCSADDKAKPDSAATESTENPAVVPVPRDKGWVKRHEEMNARLKKGNVDVIFLGDSITQGWKAAGKSEWEKRFAPLNAVNMGIGGDRTQHVLWRLDHADFSNVKPKLVVLMIGTNNAGHDPTTTGEQIGEGIKAVVAKLREKLPETKILLLGVFPRGKPDNEMRGRLAKATEIASKTADDENVYFLDIGSKFVNDDGTISKDIMPDLLHLSPRGYTIWADAIEPKVKELSGKD